MELRSEEPEVVTLAFSSAYADVKAGAARISHF
jgi:hypothetical protein